MLGRTRWGNLAHSWRIAAARAIAPRNTQLVPVDPSDRPNAIVSPSPTSKRVQHVLHTDISRWGPYTTFAAVLNPTPDGRSQASLTFSLEHDSKLLRIGSRYLNVPSKYMSLTEAWVQWFALWFWRDLVKGGEVLCRSDNEHAVTIVGDQALVSANKKATMPLEVALAIKSAVADLSYSHDIHLRHSHIPSAQNIVAHRLSRWNTPAIREATLSKEMREQVEASDKRINAMRSDLMRDPSGSRAISQLKEQPMRFAIFAIARFLPVNIFGRISAPAHALLADLFSWRTAAARALPADPPSSTPASPTSKPILPPLPLQHIPQAPLASLQHGVGRTVSRKNGSSAAAKRPLKPAPNPCRSHTPLSPSQTGCLPPGNGEAPLTSPMNAADAIGHPASPLVDIPLESSTSQLQRPRSQIKMSSCASDSHLYFGAVLSSPTHTAVNALTFKLSRISALPQIESMSFTCPSDTTGLNTLGGLYVMSFFKKELKGGHVVCSWPSEAAVMVARGLPGPGQSEAGLKRQTHRVALGGAFRDVARRWDFELEFAAISKSENVLARNISRLHLPGGTLSDARIKAMLEASNKRLRQEEWVGYTGSLETENLGDTDLTNLAPTPDESAELPPASCQTAKTSTLPQADETKLPAEPNTGSTVITAPHLSPVPADQQAPSSAPVTELTRDSDAAPLGDTDPSTPSHNPTPDHRSQLLATMPNLLIPQPTSKTVIQGYIIRVAFSGHKGGNIFSAVLQLEGETKVVDAVTFSVPLSAPLRIGSILFPILPTETVLLSAYATLVALHYWKERLRDSRVICCNINLEAVRLCDNDRTARAADPGALPASITKTITDIGRDYGVTIEHKHAHRTDNRLVIGLSQLGKREVHPWLDPAVKDLLEKSNERIVGMGIEGYMPPASGELASLNSPTLPPIRVASASPSSIRVAAPTILRDSGYQHSSSPSHTQLSVPIDITNPDHSSSLSAQAEVRT